MLYVTREEVAAALFFDEEKTLHFSQYLLI